MPYVGSVNSKLPANFPPQLERSQELLARARKVIPGASQTMSKGPSQWAQGVAPAFVRRAAGCRVWDVDGNEYLDFPMALGPVILGHCHPAITAAITTQLKQGITFTLPHPLEIEVAERIVAAVPGVERVRFAKTGSDVTSAAVRLARALTGRERVIVAGYHGWHDWYIGSTSWPLGVPRSVVELVEAVPAGDLSALEAALQRHPDQVAGVIIEPAGAREPEEGELQALVDLAHAHGSLAIFDEIVTGLRLAPGGAQEHYGVRADLTCLGKALGNGMPISALAGPAQHMDALERIFFSGTHGGETLSLAAAAATLDVIMKEPVTEHLWRQGTALQQGIRTAVSRHGLEDWVSCGGPAPMTIVTVREPSPGGHLPAKTLLQQELLRRGVLYNGTHLISYAHADEDIARGVEAYDEALEILAAGLPDHLMDYLQAPPVAPVFRSHGSPARSSQRQF
jgi:glutamate-1-semialdehyde aminotransferase